MQNGTPNQRRHVATRVMKCLRTFVSDCVRDTTMKIVFSIANTSQQLNIEDEYVCRITRAEVFPIIRDILSATLQYLKYTVCIGSICQTDGFVSIVKQIMDKNEDESPEKRLLNWISDQPYDIHKQDAFTYFQVNGLIVLCSKPNLCGYYSRGNSLDIIQLFDVIRPIIKQLNIVSYRAIYETTRHEEYPLYQIFHICANTPNTRVYGV